MSQWYFFAIFIFLLAAALVALVKHTPRSIKKREDKSFEREAKLFRLYQNIEDLMDGFEEYVEELKRDLRKETENLTHRVETLEAQFGVLRRAAEEEARRKPERAVAVSAAPKAALKLFPAMSPAANALKKPALIETKKRPEQSAPPAKEAKPQLNRNQKVMLLYAEGFPPGQIAKELGLSQNEVALVLQVEKKAHA